MADKFTLTTELAASPEKVYKAWLSSAGHSAMTGSPAEVEPRVGGAFSAWDGYITGTTLELKPFSKIVQAWRTSEFKDSDSDSRLEIDLEATKGGTRLTLVHSQIPPGQAESYKAGWDEWYFSPMTEYFEKETS